MKLDKEKYSKNSLFLLLLVGLLFVGAFIFLNHFGDHFQQRFVRHGLERFGMWAPIIFIVIYVITLIFAPITGFPFFIAAVALFGITETVLLSYVASLIGATTNFYIARIWGRPLLQKFVGKRGVEKIDKLSLNFEIEALILARLFQSFLFEWISYAAGLTVMKFRTYFIITAIASLPMVIASIILGKIIHDLGTLFVILVLVNYATLPIPFLFFAAKSSFQNKLASRRGSTH